MNDVALAEMENEKLARRTKLKLRRGRDYFFSEARGACNDEE